MPIAALFDMDGLLIESEASIMGAWTSVADHVGVKLQREEYLTVVGRAAPDISITNLPTRLILAPYLLLSEYAHHRQAGTPNAIQVIAKSL